LAIRTKPIKLTMMSAMFFGLKCNGIAGTKRACTSITTLR
jgi:hypothetical protein